MQGVALLCLVIFVAFRIRHVWSTYALGARTAIGVMAAVLVASVVHAWGLPMGGVGLRVSTVSAVAVGVWSMISVMRGRTDLFW